VISGNLDELPGIHQEPDGLASAGRSSEQSLSAGEPKERFLARCRGERAVAKPKQSGLVEQRVEHRQ
jgi:hypothetical protein